MRMVSAVRVDSGSLGRGEPVVEQIRASIMPGAWVTAKTGSAVAMTACGVTLHAQKTGSSSSLTSTG
jgi:hypothetical protein